MAINGTKMNNRGSNTRNYFVNDCSITDIEVMDSQYTDMSLKLELTDDNNGYTYICFVNQNFEKDTNDIVTGLKYPDDLNTLFVAAGCDLNVADNGVLDTKSLESLANKKVACITYKSTGKYKRNTWGVLSSIDAKEQLESRFNQQISKGYPKDYDKNIASQATETVEEKATVDMVKKAFDGSEVPF
tara:strand:- start:2587 stop:3147 length:561 start_codon:yes stop_codon:yes gene_type:complete